MSGQKCVMILLQYILLSEVVSSSVFSCLHKLINLIEFPDVAGAGACIPQYCCISCNMRHETVLKYKFAGRLNNLLLIVANIKFTTTSPWLSITQTIC